MITKSIVYLFLLIENLDKSQVMKSNSKKYLMYIYVSLVPQLLRRFQFPLIDSDEYDQTQRVTFDRFYSFTNNLRCCFYDKHRRDIICGHQGWPMI